MNNGSYERFVRSKSQLDGNFGFEPTTLPDFLFPFQTALVDWSVQKGPASSQIAAWVRR